MYATDVAIVAAGFGGLGAAIRLKRAGFEDLVVLERESEVGGTWHANSYPGSQCDIPSNLYSFSFALNPDWTHSFPEQPHIQAYLRGTAERFGVMDLGTTVAGFPDLFLVYGPNLNLGHSSIIYMLESQIRYLMDAMRSRGVETIEVRPEAQAEWNEELQRRLGGSLWNTGCSSWYLDRNGRNSIMWPGFTFGYRNRVRRFDPAAYVATGPAAKGVRPLTGV